MNVDNLNAVSILEDEVFNEIMDEKDEIERSKMIIECTSRARELGKKTEFETMLKAYQKQEKRFLQEDKEKSKPSNNSFNNYTNFIIPESAPYQNMYCGNWIADNSGIRTFTMFGERLACYHPILPVSRMENAETGMEKIKLAFCKGAKWKEIVVEKSTIASNNKIIGLSNYGVSVTSETAKALVAYLADIENYNINEIPVQTSTSKCGWINGEFMPYGKNIIFDSETKFKGAFDAIHTAGSREVWYRLAKEIRQSDRFEPKIFLVGSLASVLLEGLNALPFIINLCGTTGRGKTVATMFAASAWAEPSADFLGDAKATITAFELRLDFLNNLPLFIDDTAQSEDKYKDDFTELIYMLCAGKGKDRSNSQLGMNKGTSWKNVILTNGEHSLITETMQGGAVNRVIDVECEDGYIFHDGNKVVETIKKNYGFLGYDFIQVIQEIGMEQVRNIQQDFLQKINDAAKAKGVEKEEKQVLPMSILLAADKIATDYIFKDSVYLDFNRCVSLLKNKGEVSENERAYSFIMGEIEINVNRFHPDQYGDYHGECWGCIDNGYAVIINNIFSRMAEKGNFNKKSFLNWAEKKGLLITSAGKQTKTKKLGGSSARCVFLKLDHGSDYDSIQELLNDEEVPFQPE